MEESKWHVRDHFAEMGTPDGMLFVLNSTQLDAHGLRYTQLERAIRQTDARLIVVDTLTEWIPFPNGSINDYGEVKAKLHPYRTLTEQLNVSILFVHHERKQPGHAGDAVLGSTALLAAFDTRMSMRREGDRRTLRAEGRRGIRLEPTVITYDPDTGRCSAAGTLSAVGRKGIEERVMEYLQAEGGWVAYKHINTNVKGGASRKASAVDRLCRDGIVTSRKRPGKGGGLEYRLSQTSSSSSFPGVEEEEVSRIARFEDKS